MAGHLDGSHTRDSCKGRGNAPFHDNLLLLVSLFHNLNYTEAQHVVRSLVKICTKLNTLIHYWRRIWWVIWRDESLLMLENYWSLLFNLTLNLITLLFTRITCRMWKSQNTYWTSSPLQLLGPVSAVAFFITFSWDYGTEKTKYDMKNNLPLKGKKKPGYC